MEEQEEVEQLEAAIEAVAQKYGYSHFTVAYSPEYAGSHGAVDAYAVSVTYPNGKSATGHGSTLREALSAASVDAINGHPAA